MKSLCITLFIQKSGLFALVFLVWPGSLPVRGEIYSWKLFAGTPGSAGAEDSPGTRARFYQPEGIAIDGVGNLYVTDRSNHTIRKVTPAGVVSTLAGLPGDQGNAEGAGSAARFSLPRGIAVGADGTLYVADSGNRRIRKVTPGGVVSTLAGGSFGSADGTGTAAQFGDPVGVAVDGATGQVYVTDSSFHTLRRITPAGVVTTLAGLAGTPGGTDGTGPAARFVNPTGLALDGSATLYITEFNNHTIRKVNLQTAAVSTVAGLARTPGAADGPGGQARFYSPTGIAVGAGGVLWVADFNNNMIRRISPAGDVTTWAGNSGLEGRNDATGRDARFNNPYGIVVGPGSTLYITDRDNSTLRAVTPTAFVGTFAGTPGGEGAADSPANTARFDSPRGPSMGSDGILRVADFGNHTMRLVNGFGVVSTLAGSPGQLGTADGQGSAARFSLPAAMAVSASGDTWVADFLNYTIRKVSPTGAVSTLAGTPGAAGWVDAPGGFARFKGPNDVALDSPGDVYVADQGSHVIRKINRATLAVSTLAGLADTAGSANGSGAAARFNSPGHLSVDGAGNVYVSDTNNHTIRKITPAGGVSTLAGFPGVAGNVDGTGTGTPLFNSPAGLVAESGGTLYLTDYFNHSIRKITPAGVVTTIGGQNGMSGRADGIGAAGRFFQPSGISRDAAGNLYVADTGNRCLIKGTRHTTPWLAWLDFHQITSGANGDEDGDGMVNLLEYANGLHPRESQWTTIGVSFQGTLIRGAPRFLPGTPPDSSRYIFGRRKDRDASSLTYTVEESTNLSAWYPVSGAPLNVSGGDDELEYATQTLPATVPGGGPARFARLRVSLP